VARSVVTLGAWLVAYATVAHAAIAGDLEGSPQGTGHAGAPVRFDIDEQPMAQALRLFAQQSGVALLADDRVVAPHESRALHARVRPDEALRQLLQGSGLQARFTAMNAAFVVASPSADARAAAPGGAGVESGRSIGEVVLDALCAEPTTRPGRYRLAMQLWADDEGRVTDAVALAPSDDAVRDGHVLARIRGTRLPAGQHDRPVTLLLVPTVGDACVTFGRAAP
jgi:hypothetical protein